MSTPTLLLQGEEDHRCPVGQAEQRFTALRERSVPTRLVRYPGAGSDGNLPAGVGVPTLDGPGAVGGNPHAEGEWVDVSLIGERAARLAGLIGRLTAAGEHPDRGGWAAVTEGTER